MIFNIYINDYKDEEYSDNEISLRFYNVNQKIYVEDNCAKMEYSVRSYIHYTVDTIMPSIDATIRFLFSKILLFHVIKFNYGMDINTITVRCGEEEKIYTSDDREFPFMINSLNGIKVSLSDKWQDDIVTDALKAIKHSKDKESLNVATLYSFLMGNNTNIHETERLLHLWSALNSYYSYNAKKIIEKFKNTNDLNNEELKKQYDNLKKNLSTERGKIEAIIWMIDDEVCEHKERSISRDIKDIDKIYNCIDIIFSQDSSQSIDEQIEMFYQTFKNLDDECDVPVRYNRMLELAKTYGNIVYSFILLKLAYHIRNSVSHGNKTLYFMQTYKDKEYVALKLVNRFLIGFLEENIPSMFKESLWNDEQSHRIEQFIDYFSNAD